MIEKIKKNWKTISIVIIAILLLRGCVNGCSHDNAITKANNERTELIEKNDSIIKRNKVLSDSIKYLNLELTGERDKGNAISDAHNLGNDYYQYTINKLNDSIKSLKSSNLKKDKEIKKLNGQISNLNIEINKLKVELHNNNN